MVDESDRIWKSLDVNTEEIKFLHDKVTEIKTFIELQQKNKTRNMGLLAGAVGAFVTAINIVFSNVYST